MGKEEGRKGEKKEKKRLAVPAFLSFCDSPVSKKRGGQGDMFRGGRGKREEKGGRDKTGFLQSSYNSTSV